MSNNFIRVLRNTELCATREAAIEKLQGKLATLQDGEICIASYGGSWDAAKTILGVVRVKTVDSVAKRSYTIFDNEDTAEILKKIEALDADKKGKSADEKVSVQVVEVDGVITAVNVTTSDIASAAELGTKNDASTVDTAFGRIAKEVADRKQAITDAIALLDSSVAATAESNNQLSVLTGVTQTDGKLTEVAEVKLAAVAKTGLASDVAKAVIPNDGTYATVEGENVSEQIASIAKTIKGITTTQANALKYATVPLTSDEIKLLENASNVKEAYKVISYTGNDYKTATDKQQVGEVIKIYKDASIHKIYLGYSDDKVNTSNGSTTTGTADEAHLSLNYVYIKADGTYAMASVPVGDFLREAEFGNGLQVNSGEVSVKVADGSETFLTVDGNGVKLSGVQTAIDNKITDLHADVTGKSTGDHVTVQVIETAGKVTNVNVTTSGLALDSEVIKGVTVNGAPVTVENNTANITIDGTDVAVANSTEAYEPTVYSAPFETKVGANHIATGDTVAAAFKKAENTISVLATEVISNEKVTTAAITELAKSAGVTNTDGVIKYTPDTNTTYLKTATSVHDATVKLDAAIKTVADSANNALTSVVGSAAIGVTTKASNSQTVSLKLDTTKDGNGDGATPKPAGANALTVTDNGLYLSNVWDCGTY